jgi:hypothetical protein
MTFAEVLLRLGTALVAWMVLYAYLLWLATLRVSGCDADGDALWRLLLGIAPLAVMLSPLVGASRPLIDVHRILRWGSLPLLLLVPLAVAAVWPTWERATLGGLDVCSDLPAAAWQVWWAPLQVTALLALAVIVWRCSVTRAAQG